MNCGDRLPEPKSCLFYSLNKLLGLPAHFSHWIVILVPMPWDYCEEGVIIVYAVPGTGHIVEHILLLWCVDLYALSCLFHSALYKSDCYYLHFAKRQIDSEKLLTCTKSRDGSYRWQGCVAWHIGGGEEAWEVSQESLWRMRGVKRGSTNEIKSTSP